MVELYVHTTEERGREEYHVSDYEAPTEKYVDVDTTDESPEGSLVYIINTLDI